MEEQRPPAQRLNVRPGQIEEAPSGLRVVVYTPGGEVIFDDRATLRQFNTGSWGYHAAGKADVPRVPEQRLQVNVQLTVIGSKGWDATEVEKV